ncbi:MAG: hypothetical protein WAW95_09255 [Lactococcus raffinolactis]|jgi:hypothetical protein
MENMEWIFSGIGTTIISLIVGLAVGGGVGYKIGISKKLKQVQKAGNRSEQQQIGEIHINK